MGPVSDAAAYLFFEFERLNVLRSDFVVDDQVKHDFEAALARSKALSDTMIQNAA